MMLHQFGAYAENVSIGPGCFYRQCRVPEPKAVQGFFDPGFAFGYPASAWPMPRQAACGIKVTKLLQE
jgi:hypothetical protein